MKVVCEVTFRMYADNTAVIRDRLLSIEVEMPIAPFVGLYVALPCPKDWPDVGWGLEGKVQTVTVVGNKLFVDLRADLELNLDSINDLLAIGYESEPGTDKRRGDAYLAVCRPLARRPHPPNQR